MDSPPDRPPAQPPDQLTIDFRPLARGEGDVILSGASYGGEERVSFQPELDGADLDRLVKALEQEVRQAGGSARAGRPVSAVASAAEDAPPVDPKAIGGRLYEMLFSGPGAEAFKKTLHFAEGRAFGREGAGIGIRVRLLFSRRDADLAAHAAIPWELLYRAETRDFLARAPGYSVVREIDVDRPFCRARVGDSLRVLVVDAAPIGLRPLDLSKERRRIVAALETNPAIDVHRFEGCGVGALRATLEQDRFHVLHFMGHGDFDNRPGGSKEGCLAFENELRRAHLVPATGLAEHLKNLPDLGLVVLNACTAGALPRREGLDPFKGVASALTMAGVPATVAMQFPITDGAAIAFADTFYQRLAADERVEDAVGAGRRAIWELDFANLEWATPVLYSRAPEGKIFEIERRSRRAPASDASPQPTPAPRAAAEPLHLGIRSMDGWGPEIERDADRVLDLTGHFDGRSVRDPALWAEAIHPALRDFLLDAANTGRPLLLDLAAHWTLAFTAGALLEAKSGLEITVRQRTQNKPLDWHPEAGEIPEPPFLQERPDRPTAATDSTQATHDVAVAIAVSRPVLDDVEHYLEKTATPVARILDATVHPEPGQRSIRSGAHALYLAHALDRLIRSRTIAERYGTLHLFASAPNALLFFLGQLSRPYGHVQLYEHDFDATEPGAYSPSLRLPVSRSKIAKSRGNYE